MRFVPVVLFLFCIGTNPVLAVSDTLTTDPNTPANATKEHPAKETDRRLAQTVTYDSGEKRLHQVAADLTSMTGVAVFCGSSRSDWRVRDIPVALSVKEMPLETLLDTLAECTHVRLTSAKIGDERTYRLSRTEKVQKEIDEVLDERQRRMDAEQEWAWDAMVALGKAPDSAVKNMKRDGVLLGRIMASLEPSAKEKVMRGDVVEVPVQGSAQAPLLRELYDHMWDEVETWLQNEGQTYTAPAPENKDKAVLTVKRRTFPDNQLSDITVMMNPMPWGDPEQMARLPVTQMGIDLYRNYAYGALGIKSLQLPRPPQVNYVSDRMNETPGEGFVPVENSKSAALSEKITLESPAGDKDPSYNDLIAEVAKKSGYSIICEDYISHKGDPMRGHFKSDISLRDVFANEMHGRGLFDTSPTWFINEKSKIIVGWIGNWRKSHKSLVPEEMIVRVREKLNGAGLQLEDYLPTFTLTALQYEEWFRTPEFYSLMMNSRLGGAHTPFWRLLASLSAEDRAKAMSGEGLSFSRFSPDEMVSYFKSTQRYIRNGMLTPTPKAARIKNERLRALDAVVDPEVCPSVVMRVRKEMVSEFKTIVQGSNGPDIGTIKLPAGEQRTRYFIELEGIRDGEKFQTRIDGLELAFPVYSVERQAELTKSPAE